MTRKGVATLPFLVAFARLAGRSRCLSPLGSICALRLKPMKTHYRYCYAAFCLLLLSGVGVAAATDDRGSLLVERMMTSHCYKAKVGDVNYREAFVCRYYAGWTEGLASLNREVVVLTSCFLGVGPLKHFLQWYERRCGCFTQGYWLP